MTNTPTTQPVARAAVRAVAMDLQAARATQIAKVVSMVDQMPVRGQADDVIAPLRPRLGTIRPPRPLRLPRLLFMPLDGAIVAPASWKRGLPTIPRSVLLPITQHVRSLLGPLATTIEAEAQTTTTADAAAIHTFGSKLWHAAGDALIHAPPPPGWQQETGLQPSDFRTLAANIAAVLLLGRDLTAITAAGGPATVEAQQKLSVLLADTALKHNAALPTVVICLLATWPDCTPVVALCEKLGAQAEMATLRHATEGAIEYAIGVAESSAALPEDISVAETELKRAVSLLEACDGRPGQTAERGQRLRELRKRYEREARNRFDTTLTEEILAPSVTAVGGDSAAIAAVEARARELRRFESTARRLGTREHYDRALRKAADQIRPQAGDPPLMRADKLRLVEIFAGAEAAMALMKLA